MDDKGAMDLKKMWNPYLDKGQDVKKITQFNVEDVFGDILGKKSISPRQKTKLKNFPAKLIWFLK